ncbi:hypothetical protein I4U23_028058 [Adineta vaga]|nr:hypothetical protein I4U23_028058 [Adineta vaga]
MRSGSGCWSSSSGSEDDVQVYRWRAFAPPPPPTSTTFPPPPPPATIPTTNPPHLNHAALDWTNNRPLVIGAAIGLFLSGALVASICFKK